ncbi:MAG: translation initiation factor IF-2 [SAR324 cluster bacterium]|nr:translation initiation factor IF-2 [SAR324 cluster bacterium]
MSTLRVFELAREYKTPVRQFLQVIRQGGVDVNGHFDELTEEQAALVKKIMKAPGGGVASSKGAATGVRRRVISARKEEDEVEPEEEAEEETNKVITIKARTRTDDGENRPRRIRRATKSEASAPAEEKPDEAAVAEPSTEAEAPEGSAKESEAKKPVATPESPKSDDTPTAEAEKPAPKTTPAAKQEAAKTKEPQARKQAPEDKKAPKKAGDADKKGAKKEKRVEHPNRPERWEDKDALRASQKPGKSKAPFKDYYSSEEEDILRRRKKSDRHRDHGRARGTVSANKSDSKHVFNPRRRTIKIGNSVTVGDLASLIGIRVPDILKKLMDLGTMATITQSIPGETATLIAAEFDVEVENETFEIEDAVREETIAETDLESRSPIVTIMGHVDHGKTSLLDYIRATKVVEGEAGGITQHIGAYPVESDSYRITFLDTPGHQAFSEMRARGAQATDLVVLVVAADDKVQPQTIEAINHAKAAEVPIIVAVNKVDRPEANPDRIRQELLEHELVAEEFGGDTIMLNVSALKGDGVDQLLEMIQLQAEVLELTSTAKGLARGVIIESRITRGQGAVASVLVQRGTLKVGDSFVVGSTFGRVRAMYDDMGQPVREAGPTIPVELTGLSEVPAVGEQFVVLEDEKAARQIAEQRGLQLREDQIAQRQRTNLQNFFENVKDEDEKELLLLLKADVQGSVEAIKSSLEQLATETVSVQIIHSAVGSITESDVTLAAASNAIIIGFNVQTETKAKELQAREGTDIRSYNVIYEALDDVRAAMTGLLSPEIVEEVLGHCEVREVFAIAKTGTVFGCYVRDGRILRNSLARILRNDETVFNGSVLSLKRFKDDVREVTHNYECGVVMDFPEVQAGDTLEVYQHVEVAATL